MPSLIKLLSRFDKSERVILESLIGRIFSLDWRNLDIKKLKGYKNIFRIRKGNFRIIYQLMEGKEVYVLTIERRSETTYKNL